MTSRRSPAKRLAKRLVAGLREIEGLAEADAAADPGRYPPSHPIWKALQWLNRVIAEEKA